MPAEVSGNFSIALPVLSDTRGFSFSLFDVSWLFATRDTLLALLDTVS